MVMFMPRTSNGFTPEYNNDYFTVSSEYNTEYDFVIARLNTLIGLIHQAEQELSSKDQASKGQASPTPSASIDAPCSSMDKLNRLQEDAYQILCQYQLEFFDSKKYPGTLEDAERVSLTKKRKELDSAISEEFSPHRSEVSIGQGSFGAAYILLHPQYEANIQFLIKYLHEVCATYGSVTNLTDQLEAIRVNLEAVLTSEDEDDLKKNADEHLELLREWKTSFKGYLATLDDNQDLGINHNKELQTIKYELHRRNAPIVRSDPNNPASSLLSVEKDNLSEEETVINSELSIYKGTSLKEQPPLGNQQTPTLSAGSQPGYCIYKSMANAAMDLANFYAKYCRPHQDIKLENQADDGLFDEMSRDQSIATLAGSPKYTHPYMLKLFGSEHKTVSANLWQSRLSTVVDARALGISFINKILPDFDVKLVPGEFYVGNHSPRSALSLFSPSRYDNEDFLNTTNIIKATRIKLEELYDSFGTDSPVRLARIVSTFIRRMITIKPKIFGCIPGAGNCDNSFISAAMQHCKHVPTDIEQVQFFSLLHRLMDLTQGHGSVQSKDEINREIKEIITRLDSLAKPSEYVLTAKSDETTEISLRGGNQDQLVVANIPDSCNDNNKRKLFMHQYTEENYPEFEKPTTYVYLARSDDSVVISQVKPNGCSEKDIVTIEDSDIDDIYDGDTLFQLKKKNKQFLDIQKEIKTVDTSNASGSEGSGTALKSLFANQRDLIAADKLDRPSYQYAIINQGKRDALKTLFKRSIAQGHPAPEVQLFVDPHLRDELTIYQDSIEESFKNSIDSGSTVDDLHKRDEGSRPPYAMRVRLQEYYFKTFFGKISYDRPHKTKLLPKHVQKYCAAVRLMHILTNPCEEQSRRINMVCTIYPLATSKWVWASRLNNLYNDVENYLKNDGESSSNSELLNARLVEYTSKLERENKSVKMYIRKTLSPQPSSGSSFFGGTKRSNKYQVVDSATSSCATPPQVHS